MNAPSFVYEETVADYPLTFKWWGGEYIDVCWRNGTAFEVINVWAAGTDHPRIERSQDAFEETVRAWIDEGLKGSLAWDLANNYGGRR